MAYPENVNEVQPSSAAGESTGSVLDNLAKARDISGLERLRVAAVQTGHAAYQWNILTDTLTWSENAAQVLKLELPALPETGKGYRLLVSSEARETRDDLILDNIKLDDGNGIEFDTAYSLAASGEATGTLGIEERGRVRLGQDGKAREVFAIVRRQHSEQADQLADGFSDEETGLASKKGILDQLERFMHSNDKDGFGLLVAKISNIANISSTYGPAVVPDVVRAVAARLRSVMRGVDILGRSAPNQFAILLRECSGEQIQVAGERFISAIRDDVIETPYGPVWVEFCAGGIILSLATNDPVEAFALAEETSVQAESGAGDCYLTYRPSPDRQQAHLANRESAREIIQALNTERFTLWHQPIVSGDTHEPCMFESLLRMQTPEGKIISAAHLVPLAEKLGFMHMIDAMVCRTSIQLVREREDAVVSFNISEGSLNNSYAAARLQSFVAEARHLAPRLCVELSFGDMETPSAGAVQFVQKLRTLGCRIALSGYFTKRIGLDVLQLVDFVKLDGSICSGIASRPKDIGLLKAAIEFARRSGPKIIAEHVENEEDAAVLTEAGVDYLQGYLFGQASPEYFNLTLSKPGDIPSAIEDVPPDKFTAASNKVADTPDIQQAVAEISVMPAKAELAAVEASDHLEIQSQKPEGTIDLLRSALGKLDAI